MKANFLKNRNIKVSNKSFRSKVIIKNIAFSFLSKIVSVFLSFALIPLTIGYLNQEIYGIWITLLSILTWFGVCDIGLGNGLRNKIAENLSNGKIKEVRQYISTGYGAISLIIIVISIPLMIIIPIVDWNKILNTNSLKNIELIKFVYVTTLFFMINFILSLIRQIYYAYQKSMVVGFIQMISSGITLIGVFLLRFSQSKSLVSLAIIYGMATLFTNLIFTIHFFKSNKEVIPNIKYISKQKISSILNIGLKFFIIQISSIIITTTDNIVITQISGPQYVTGYNLVYKIFSMATMVHLILIGPLWSAYTDAYFKKDFKWLKDVILKLNLLMIPIIVGISTITVFFNFIIKIWIGQPVDVSKRLIVLVGIYTVIIVWNNVYAYFLNGVGYLKLSYIISVMIIFINIPLAIFLGKSLHLGVEGVVLANILCLLPYVLLQPIQTYIILHQKLQNSIFYE